MAEIKKNYLPLILKNTPYGEMKPKGSPLSIAEFEGNFVLLANSITKTQGSVDDLKSSVDLNGSDISEMKKTHVEIKKTLGEFGKESAITKGRVDVLETAVEELGASLPDKKEVALLASKSTFEQATNLQIAVDAWTTNAGNLSGEAMPAVRQTLQAAADASVSTSKSNDLPTETLTTLLENNFNCTVEMLNDYLATAPEVTEVTYDGTKNDVISEGVELAVDGDGYFYTGSDIDIEWSLGWDFTSNSVDDRDWSTDLSDFINDPETQILTSELVFRFHSSATNPVAQTYATADATVVKGNYSYYRVVVKSKSNIRNNRTAATDATKASVTYTYLRQQVDPNGIESYSIAKDYLKYLVATDRVFTKGVDYFMKKYDFEKGGLDATTLGVLSYLSDKTSIESKNAILGDVFTDVFGSNGISSEFAINKTSSWSLQINNITELTNYISIYENIDSGVVKGLFQAEDTNSIISNFVSTMLGYGFVVPQEVLTSTDEYGQTDNNAIVEQCADFFENFYIFLGLGVNMLEKSKVVSEKGISLIFDGGLSSAEIGTDTYDKLLSLYSLFNLSSDKKLAGLSGIKDLLSVDPKMTEWQVKADKYDAIAAYISKAYTNLIKVDNVFASFISEYSNAILKFAQLMEIGIENSYTLITIVSDSKTASLVKTLNSLVEAPIMPIVIGERGQTSNSGLTREFLDNPYHYDVLVSKYKTSIDTLSENIPTVFDPLGKMSLVQDIENWIDTRISFLRDGILTEVKAGDLSLFDGGVHTSDAFDPNKDWNTWHDEYIFGGYGYDVADDGKKIQNGYSLDIYNNLWNSFIAYVDDQVNITNYAAGQYNTGLEVQTENPLLSYFLSAFTKDENDNWVANSLDSNNKVVYPGEFSYSPNLKTYFTDLFNNLYVSYVDGNLSLNVPQDDAQVISDLKNFILDSRIKFALGITENDEYAYNALGTNYAGNWDSNWTSVVLRRVLKSTWVVAEDGSSSISDNYVYKTDWYKFIGDVYSSYIKFRSSFEPKEFDLLYQAGRLFTDNDNIPYTNGFGLLSVLEGYTAAKSDYPKNSSNSFLWDALNASLKEISDILVGTDEAQQATEESLVLELNSKFYLIDLSKQHFNPEVMILARYIMMLSESNSNYETVVVGKTGKSDAVPSLSIITKSLGIQFLIALAVLSFAGLTGQRAYGLG